MRLCALLLIALTVPLTSHSVEPNDTYPDVEHDTPLSTAALIEAFRGKTHLGSYNFLNRNITSYAFEETTRLDGGIRHVQQSKVDTGKWHIEDGVICYDYDDPSLTQACFKMYVRGNCYFHYQVSTNGRTQYGFTARSVIKGETPNCEPSFV